MNNYRIIANYIHWAIMALSLYAVGCCGFHILPAWGYSDNYETINTTLLSIALSYIAGYIIYWLTSVLPQKQSQNDVFELWKPHLSDLYNEMTRRIEEVITFSGIPKNNNGRLTEDDCEPLKNYSSMPPVIRISKTIIRDNPPKPLKLEDEFDFKRDLNRHYDAMKYHLDVMLNNPMAIYADKHLLELLSRIKESDFLKDCSKIIGGPVIYNGLQVNITTADLPKAFVGYVMLKNELGKLPIQKFVFNMRKLTDEEVKASNEAIKEHLAKMGMTLEMEKEISQKIAIASKKK